MHLIHFQNRSVLQRLWNLARQGDKSAAVRFFKGLIALTDKLGGFSKVLLNNIWLRHLLLLLRTVDLLRRRTIGWALVCHLVVVSHGEIGNALSIDNTGDLLVCFYKTPPSPSRGALIC